VSPAPVRVFIGLGSNLGDRLAHLRRAVDLLSAAEGVEVIRTSRVYETEPVGPPQPDFLNAVAEASTTLPPSDLMRALLRIEQEMGRVRAERWGPRVIDLDLLNYGPDRIDEPGLIVPHPRMHERAFVMIPLLELEDDPLLPAAGGMARYRPGPEAEASVRPFAPPIRSREG
jgi:2-amino-4-hydroxy-6-hydroxymethyldihydropteridine diphosphokinase